MVALNKIYTKTGDKGTTGLVGGERRAKHDLRVETYGTVDELNAVLGLVRVSIADDPELCSLLARIQNELFDLGADLANPKEVDDKAKDLRILPSYVDQLEKNIDHYNDKLEPLRSFVLPGGTSAAANLHFARTVARRAERLVSKLQSREPGIVNPTALHYLNRLSDLLFVLARFSNDTGKADVLWVPGGKR